MPEPGELDAVIPGWRPAPGHPAATATGTCTGSTAEGTGPVSVVVVSPVRLYREGLALLLTGAACRVVGTAGGCADLPGLVGADRPDVVLLDAAVIRTPDCLDAVRHTAADVRVVAFGVREDVEEMMSCARAGVGGYVSRDAPTSELLAVLDTVRSGDFGCSPSLAAALLQRVSEGRIASGLRVSAGPADAAKELSSRELEIAALMSEGLMNKQIARRLGLSLSTVKNHVHNILRKQGVTSRQQMVQDHRSADARLATRGPAR